MQHGLNPAIFFLCVPAYLFVGFVGSVIVYRDRWEKRFGEWGPAPGQRAFATFTFFAWPFCLAAGLLWCMGLLTKKLVFNPLVWVVDRALTVACTIFTYIYTPAHVRKERKSCR